ncbi:unnamed protein product [Calypogeia fissa]
MSGLSLGAIGIDWATVSSFLGTPLATPWFAIANIAVGYFIVMYIITPVAYFMNVYNAKNFPIFLSSLFKSTGEIYDVEEIISSTFMLDIPKYEQYGRLHISTFFAMTYGVGFAVLTCTITHVPGLNIITEYIIGYLYPGHPVANVSFKTYGYISMTQAISFLVDFKLGHYMKIPPRSMFVTQAQDLLMTFEEPIKEYVQIIQLIKVIKII